MSDQLFSLNARPRQPVRPPRPLSALLCAVIACAAIPLNAAAPDHQLRVSEDQRYLEDAAGNGVFLHGDTAWNLGILLDRDEVVRYLDERKRQRFNIIGVGALFEDNYTNVFGDVPFGTTSGNWDPNLINEVPGNDPNDPAAYDYWDHLDYVVEEIAKRDMYVSLVICFNSMVVGNGHGKRREKIVFNENNAYTYGYWIGERYRHHDHILWMIGGDRSPVYGEFDYQPVFHAMAEGVADGIKQTPGHDGLADYSDILMSYHPQKDRPTSSEWFHDAPWMSFNSVQACPSRLVETIKHDWAMEPTKPVWMFEGRYEEYTFEWKAWPMRFQAYHSIFAGAFGHLYGNTFIWGFPEKWEQHLIDPGTEDMVHVYELLVDHLRSVGWGNWQPFDELFLDEDLGEVDATCWKYATTAAATSNQLSAMISHDRRTALAYSANGRSFTLNLAEMSEDVVEGAWFDPRNGHWFNPATKAETVPPTRFPVRPDNDSPIEVTFDPPGEPGVDNDWVLVLYALHPDELVDDTTVITLEAESGWDPRKVSLQRITDPGAAGQAYITQPRGQPSWEFEVEQAGAYRLFGRFFAQDWNNDSFSVKFTDAAGETVTAGPWNNINTTAHNSWAWDVLKLGIDATDEVATMEFTPGRYTFAIAPRDANEIKKDMFVLTTDPSFDGENRQTGHTYISFEAESGSIAPPFAIFEKESAYGDHYVAMHSANATYPFTIDDPGEYRILGYVYGPDHQSDSMFVILNDQPMEAWHFAEDKGWGKWKWVGLALGGESTFALSAGEHELVIIQREPGARIDQIVITNDLALEPESPRSDIFQH